MESIVNGGAEVMPEDAVSGQAHEQSVLTLTGSLGTFDIVFTVLAYNAPLTVVTGFLPLILSKGNGLGAPVTFVIAGTLMLLFSVGFTTMTRHVPNAGAFYAYITAGLGRPLGLGSAFIAILSYAFMMTGMYLYIGVTYGSLAKSIFGDSPLLWWEWSLLLFSIVGILGYMRISLSAKVLTVALVCEILLVFAWEIAIVAHKGMASLSPVWLTPGAATSGSVGVGILLGVTSFAGFEATAVFREEARRPDVTVPRATYLSIFLMSATFASAAYFLIVAYGPRIAVATAAAEGPATSINSIGAFLGTAGLETVSVLLCSSCFAACLAMHNILSRYIYSLGIDGTLPRAFAAIHERHGSPHRASLLVSLASLIALLVLITKSVDPYAVYGILTGAGGYALLLLEILTSLSVLVYFIRKGHVSARWKTRYAPLASFVALCATGWLATTNMQLLTGAKESAIVLPLFIFAALVTGVLYALRLRKSNPGVYQAIGRQNI